MATSRTPMHLTVSSDPTHVESVQWFGWFTEIGKKLFFVQVITRSRKVLA
jgi:hypothetical protein